MTALQIVLLSIAGAFAICSIVFMVMFLVEISVKEKSAEEREVKSIFSEEYVKEENKTESVDSMLAKLDEQAEETKEEPKVEPVTLVEIEEAKPIEEVEEESVEEPTEEIAEVEPVTEGVSEESIEEIEGVVEEVKPVEEPTEEIDEAQVVEDVKEETVEVEAAEEEPVTVEVIEEGVKEPEAEGETISPETLLDYKSRLEKIIENRDKINKDLIKVEKSILNYERTKRRKLRNQKMLDRRASELTNLNLVMYSVTDIKNVDEDKKVKQEELTSHIAELKASIQDADEFLDSNKEKNDHDVKMAKFLIQEKARYNEEIAELQKLIAKTEGTAA